MLRHVARLLSRCGWLLLWLPVCLPAETLLSAQSLAAQPLAQALAQFDEHTGYAGFYRAELVRGRQSGNAVLAGAPQQILQQLLEGTGLQAEFTSATRYVLSPLPPDTQADWAQAERSVAARQQRQLQQQVVSVLCASPATAPGGYRLALALTVAVSGGLQAVELLGSSGDRERDALIQGALLQLRFDKATAEVQETFVVLITPSSVSPCDRSGRDRSGRDRSGRDQSSHAAGSGK